MKNISDTISKPATLDELFNEMLEKENKFWDDLEARMNEREGMDNENLLRDLNGGK